MEKNPCSIFARAERKRKNSEFLSAIPLYLTVKRLSGKDMELRLSCLFSLGDTYRMVGEFKKAEKCYKEAHSLSLAIGKKNRFMVSGHTSPLPAPRLR